MCHPVKQNKSDTCILTDKKGKPLIYKFTSLFIFTPEGHKSMWQVTY